MKKIMTLILTIALLLTGTVSAAQAANYTDISGHWAEKAIKKVTEKKSAPFEKNKFQPNKAITRSEFAVMLHDALGINISYFKAPVVSDYFADIKQDAPYANDVIDLVTANIIDDQSKTFNPDGKLPRDQMVHYIINALKYKMGENYAYIKIKEPNFKDINQIKPEYRGDVAIAVYYKLVTGCGKDLFKPRANATRAEAAKVINNLIEYIDKVQKEDSKNVVIKPDAVLKNNSLEMKISITNNTGKDVVFQHSSGQKYDFVLLDSNKKEIYVWSADKSFIMALTTTTVQAWKTIEFKETLSGDQFTSIKDKAVYLKAYLKAISDSFAVNPDGYEIKLK